LLSRILKCQRGHCLAALECAQACASYQEMNELLTRAVKDNVTAQGLCSWLTSNDNHTDFKSLG
jgi:hypothetical protein